MNITVSCDHLVETLRAAPTLLRRTMSATRARRGNSLFKCSALTTLTISLKSEIVNVVNAV